MMSDPLDTFRSAIEDVITSWPDVRAKRVFGHRGYVHGGKMFAFLAEGGLAFKAARPADAQALYDSGAATPFIYDGTKEMAGWPVLPLTTDDELSAALTAAQSAYEHVG
jgi:TfoX/Sxy family transcriptional regulator of competence genes